MINQFLRAKHWQLFLLTFGIPMVLQFVMMGRVFASIGNSNPPDPTVMLDFMNYFPILMILYTVVFFCWFWSVVVGLQPKIPQECKTKLIRFKVFFFIPLIYMILISVLMVNIFSELVNNPTSPDPTQIGSIVAIIIPLHLFSIFGIFHTIYFAAKTFKTAELKRKVSFSDFIEEFFLIWFYPIGVWILQPKINKLVSNHSVPD